MAKYKEGDLVRVRSDLTPYKTYYMHNRKDNNIATYSMCTYAGKIVTIICVKEQYRVKECSGWWTDDMFETLYTEITTKSESKKSTNQEDINMKFKIKSSKIVNNKGTQVMFVEFADGDIQKAVCMPGDTFDEERGFEICIMKHVLGGSNNYHKVLKDAKKQVADILEKEKKEKEEAENIAKKKEKLEAYKAKRAEKQAEKDREAKEAQRAERVADMTEAFLAALKANGIDANVKDVSESTLNKILSVFKK